MKFYSPKLLLIASTCLVTSSAGAITVEEDPVIYAVGALQGNIGVYKLPLEGSFPSSPEKISADILGGVQWSFRDSGGTFVSKDKAVGTAYSYSTLYVAVATAEGNSAGDGPWTYSTYQSMGSSDMTLRATDMVYDPTGDKVYTWAYADTYGYSTALGIFDADARSVQLIGAPGNLKINALAIDGDGTLWGISGNSGKIYTIDKATGAATEKFSIPTAYGDNQSAAWDAASGKIYWGAVSNAYSASLYAIDTAAQTYAKVYDFPTGKRYNGFYIPGPSTKAGAPAAPENLTASYSGTENGVTVTFTAPSLTHGGTALSGELSYTVLVDGQSADTGTINAGAEYSKILDMTPGSHTVTVYLTNSIGDGDKATTPAFSGYDAPTAVTDLTLAADGNSITLTWGAPAGQNGGSLDMSKITYNVTRMPGNVEIATGITDTTVSDEIPQERIREYSYVVTVVNDGEAGPAATTAGIMIGDPYTVPFSQNFDDATDLSETVFKAVGNDLWQLDGTEGDKVARLTYKYYSSVNAHLFTAPIQFYTGVTYTLKFKIACPLAGESPQLRVNLSKSQSTNTADFIYPWITTRVDYTSTEENKGQFQQLEYTFTVPEDGIYSVDFYDTTTSWVYQGVSSVAIDDIEITGVFPTPMPVSGLVADPVETGSRDIMLTFQAPLQDTEGNDLESISKIEIKRGSETVAELETKPGTEEPILPGDVVEYTVENAPRGFQAYQVTAYYKVFASAPATVTVMSGYLNDLVLTEVEFPEEEIPYLGAGTVKAKVFNNGADLALDYTVVLLAEGVAVDMLYGETIHTDETLEYEFAIDWAEDLLSGTKYAVEVVFYGDEDLTNNKSDEYAVNFEKKPESLDTVEASGITVTGADGMLTVTGAEGKDIRVFTADGRLAASAASASGTWSVKLAPGIYFVTAGTCSHKAIVR